jgi:hypothetical protein
MRDRDKLLRLTERFNDIVERVENRCMAVDGPVTPTLQEMQESELRELWRIIQAIRKKL